MNANKTASARSLKSDLKRVDAHRIRAKEYKELPELTDAMLARGVVNKGGRPMKPDNERKRLITLRLSPGVLKFYRATGRGWQSRIDADLRKRASAGVR